MSCTELHDTTTLEVGLRYKLPDSQLSLAVSHAAETENYEKKRLVRGYKVHEVGLEGTAGYQKSKQSKMQRSVKQLSLEPSALNGRVKL